MVHRWLVILMGTSDVARGKSVKIWQVLSRWFHGSPRQAVELLIFVLILLTCAPSERSLIVGGVISAVGVLARLIASGYRYEEASFQVRGPYRYVRHPHHFGSIAIAVGFAIAGQNIGAALLTFATLAVFFRAEIAREEERLTRSWGPRYGVFRANVSAIIPQLFPFIAAGGAGRRFSLAQSLRNDRYREVNATVVVLAGFFCLFLATRFGERQYFDLIIVASLLIFLVFRVVYYGYGGKNQRRRGVVSITES